jgi:hypothetical protein
MYHLSSRYASALKRVSALRGDYNLSLTESEHHHGFSVVELLDGDGRRITMGSGTCTIEAAEIAISRAAAMAVKGQPSC